MMNEKNVRWFPSFSMEEVMLLGKGTQGQVYQISTHWVAKVSCEHVPFTTVLHEANIHQAFYDAGIAVSEPIGLRYVSLTDDEHSLAFVQAYAQGSLYYDLSDKEQRLRVQELLDAEFEKISCCGFQYMDEAVCLLSLTTILEQLSAEDDAFLSLSDHHDPHHLLVVDETLKNVLYDAESDSITLIDLA